MRRAPRARAPSSASWISAEPTPWPREASRTNRSSSQQSSDAVQTLWRKRSWHTPVGGESSSGVARRYSVFGSSLSRSTLARNALADGQSFPIQSRKATSSRATDSASSYPATHARAGMGGRLAVAVPRAALGPVPGVPPVLALVVPPGLPVLGGRLLRRSGGNHHRRRDQAAAGWRPAA